jgi:hypothetical protein
MTEAQLARSKSEPMSCKTAKASIYYGPQGDPTGKFKMECDGKCTAQGEECRPVYFYGLVETPSGELIDILSFCCRCVKVQGGEYDPQVDPQPIPLLCDMQVGWKVGFEVLVPACLGKCDNPEEKECRRVPDGEEVETFVIRETGYVQIVKVLTYHCDCLPKEKPKEKKWL